MDVDYAYPSRLKSFLFTFLNKKTSKDYLKNAKIIAKMVNESPLQIKAYWFFTPQTTPDKEMLRLMHPDKHEVALHIATQPRHELENLEKITGRKLNYYTIHGTERLFARLMWRRKIWQDRVPIPKGFPLKNFWDFPTLSLDRVCYSTPTPQALRIAQKSVEKGEVLHIHPEWLFQRGTLNHRGPYHETLKALLNSGNNFEGLVIRKKGFIKMAQYAGTREYEQDRTPTDQLISELVGKSADVFTFIERKWHGSLPNPPREWAKVEDNIAILHITDYDKWWKAIGKKTRNMIRKAEKNGVTVAVVKPDERLAKGIWKIYNETPIRQGRAFPHYGISLENVKSIINEHNSELIGAYLQNELIGFIQLIHGDNLSVISQILSLQQHWDKAVNNAMIAKVVEICAQRNIVWVMYGRMGNHPSLDNFKLNNNFIKFTFTRYYVPLTNKGQIAIRLNMHQEIKDVLPEWIKKPLFPAFNWVSRTKVKIRHRHK